MWMRIQQTEEHLLVPSRGSFTAVSGSYSVIAIYCLALCVTALSLTSWTRKCHTKQIF